MTDGTVADGSEPADLTPTAVAADVFGPRLPVAEQYVRLLAGDGVAHGHLGPREVPRLWQRHLVNSALLADLLPSGATVLDVGSGAGLPGVPTAIRRPDLTAVLLEPMARRVRFLERAVSELGLEDQVRVRRGRADDRDVRAEASDQDWIVARAVAPLDRLVRWCLPLLRPGGVLLALKGERAESELTEHRRAVAAAGGREPTLERIGADVDQTWVIRIERSTATRPATRGRR